MDQPLSDTLASPWVFVRTFPECFWHSQWRLRPESPTYLSLAGPVDGFTHRRSLRARSPFTRLCRSFCCAVVELIRDQTPPDDFCNCYYDVRATKPGLSLLAGTMASTTFLFFPHHAALQPKLLSSDAWRAALRPLRRSRCQFFPVTRVCLAAIPPKAPHHRQVLPRGCIVRIDEHGSKDRVKDASRSACNGVPCLRPDPTHCERRTTAFPSLAFLRTSAVTGALSTRGGNRGYQYEPT